MMASMRRFAGVIGVCVVLIGVAPVCEAEDGGGGLGFPCETDEDCEADLSCDVHDDIGSCQRPHVHGDGSEG